MSESDNPDDGPVRYFLIRVPGHPVEYVTIDQPATWQRVRLDNTQYPGL